MQIKRMTYIVTLLMCLTVSSIASDPKDKPENTEAVQSESQIEKGGKLVIVWTSGDKEVAIKMVLMYTYRKAKHWDEVTLIIWGPSAKLTSEDEEIQDYLKKLMEAGITVKACIACARMYGVDKKLEDLGITVKGMGDELTSYIKEGRHILTF